MTQGLTNLPKVTELTNGRGFEPMLSLDFLFNKHAQNFTYTPLPPGPSHFGSPSPKHRWSHCTVPLF